MAGPKNPTNAQWGRVAIDGNPTTAQPNAVVASPFSNDGREPLVDQFGRVIVTTSPNPGAALNIQGCCEHDTVHDPAECWPVNIGGVAYNQAPADVQSGDCVQSYFDLQGRQQVNQELLIAGEDLINHVLAVTQEPLDVEQHSPDRSSSSAAEATRVAKASAGRIFKAWGTNANGGVRYLQLHNTAAAPAGGAIPIISISVATLLQGIIEIDERGMYLDTGITVAFSTTQNIYTAAGSDHIITVLYK